MIDTVKLGIPLTPKQYERLRKAAAENDRWQRILYNEARGEMLFRRVAGDARMDENSYHRTLLWQIPPEYETDCCLEIEFSVPKYWYGHNIHLLSDFTKALQHLKGVLEQQFGLKRLKLPNVREWKLKRLDLCYAWRFPSQALAQRYLDSLKRLHYPRKRPVIYPTSIVFAGNTYSTKIYLKLPEFKHHDRKELLKAKASLEYVNHLERKADGVLRFEATLRPKFLRRYDIQTVGNLLFPIYEAHWHDETEHPYQPDAALWGFLGLYDGTISQHEDGTEFVMHRCGIGHYDEKGNIETYWHPGGKFTFRKRDRGVAILQYLLEKFIGANSGMQRVDEVESRLLEHFKPTKAARLVSMWLYVQRFGTAKTKETFGRNSYYCAKSDLKKAGVSFVEPPSSVTTLDQQKFIQDFRLEVPSEHVTNKFDDHRDSDNILNFVPKTSGNF